MDVALSQTFLFQLSLAGTTTCRRYNPNVAYQPEVSGATAAVPGYSEFTAFYGFYRVVKYHYKCTFSNMEAFPVSIYCINSNNDPGTTAALIVSNNALSQNWLLSSKGGLDTKTFSKTLTIAQVLGSDAVETADSYRALITGAPSDIAWLGFGAQSGTGTNITIGVTCMLELTMYVRFYDRLLQT